MLFSVFWDRLKCVSHLRWEWNMQFNWKRHKRNPRKRSYRGLMKWYLCTKEKQCHNVFSPVVPFEFPPSSPQWGWLINEHCALQFVTCFLWKFFFSLVRLSSLWLHWATLNVRLNITKQYRWQHEKPLKTSKMIFFLLLRFSPRKFVIFIGMERIC